MPLVYHDRFIVVRTHELTIYNKNTGYSISKLFEGVLEEPTECKGYLLINEHLNTVTNMHIIDILTFETVQIYELNQSIVHNFHGTFIETI